MKSQAKPGKVGSASCPRFDRVRVGTSAADHLTYSGAMVVLTLFSLSSYWSDGQYTLQ